jgi:hypothetical protein
VTAGNLKKSSEPKPKVSSARLRAKLTALVVSSVISLGLGEIALRAFMAKDFPIFQNEKNLLYRYDETLGWFPIPNTTNRVSDVRTILAIHNSSGFRDVEHLKNAVKLRLLFLGDSYVWGYDAEAPERFTDKLQAKHPEWEVLNCGISGYGTDQEFLLLQRIYDKYKPHVVFLVFCTENDEVDNRWNFRHESYFKPYYTTNEHRLELHGVPVPRSERAVFLGHPLIFRSYLLRLFVRAYCKITTPPRKHVPSPTFGIFQDMQKYLQARGTILVVGLTRKSPRLEAFLSQLGIPHVDFQAAEQYPRVGHWTPQGHDTVCEEIDRFMKTNGVMSQHSQEPGSNN